MPVWRENIFGKKSLDCYGKTHVLLAKSFENFDLKNIVENCFVSENYFEGFLKSPPENSLKRGIWLFGI